MTQTKDQLRMRHGLEPASAQSSEPGKMNGAFWGGMLILFMFGATFTGLGLMAVVMGIKGFAHPEKNAWVPLVVGPLFTLVGIAFDSGLVYLFYNVRRERRVLKEFPDQPWMLNRSWASGRIKDDVADSTIGAWIFAVLWNAVAWPSFIVAITNHDAGKMIFVIALLPLIGLGILASALYQTGRRLKFGRSVLKLETMPACIGGWLAGTIETAKVIDASDGIRIALKCVNRVTTGSGKNSSTSEYVLWQEEQILGGRLPRQGLGLALPVAFSIPHDCTQTRSDDSRNQIVWRLIASASEPGIDFKATFEVPVFQVDGPPDKTPALEAQAAKLRQPMPSAERAAADAHINIRKDTAGREFFEFPWTRNAKQGLTVIFFGIVFVGIGIGVAMADSPASFFSIAFNAVGALILLGGIMWLKSRSIAVLQDAIELRWSLFGFGRSQLVPRRSVTGVSYDAASIVNNVQYYKIKLATSDGPKIVAAGGLILEDAKFVARELSAALGLEPPKD